MAKGRESRNTYLYELLGRNGKVLYKGYSKDPVKRAEQHRRAGKRFKKLRVNPYPCSEKIARKRERKSITTYEKNQGGKPRYNKKAG